MNTRHSTAKHPKQTSYRHRAGFSLVELMVAMTLSLILIGGVVSVVVNTSRTHGELSNTSRQLENGRYAMQVLREDIRHAGFYGEFHELTEPTAAPEPCDVALADLEAGMGLPVQGYAGAAAAPLDCLPDYVPDTDVLVIRRASTAVAAGALDAGEVYLQSRSDEQVMDTGANAAAFTLTKLDGVTPAEIRRYVVHIYYIRGCSDCSGGGDGIPTLSRVELSGGNLNTVAPLAEGIENLQLRYGVDTNDDGAPNDFVTLPGSLDAWFDVVTIEVNLLARGVDPTQGHDDDKTYTLGDVDIAAPGDNFKRHVFSSVTRVVNTSSRREI